MPTKSNRRAGRPPSDPTTPMGKLLRRARGTLTQHEAAEQIGYKADDWRHYESGHRVPDAAAMLAIHEAFGVDVLRMLKAAAARRD